ncbi:MAG TPA: DUF177 domain-containing protein [Thermoanaerobaculia bacterium]|nr:DUF177 domain-containing protein [Thermoanaerobaculia bacterium]
MRIWLDQVRDEPFDWEETQEVRAERLERPELLNLGPVSWRGQIVFVDPAWLLRARLSYEQTLACNRCLRPFTEPAAPDVELLLEVGAPAVGGGEHELHGQDLGTVYLEDEVLETEPILLEQLELNIPMKPLCRPDCQGLCPTCGADLNVERCACEERSGDPRWAALAALRDRLGGDE